MTINYKDKIVPMEDQTYLATILHKIQTETDINKKVNIQEEVYKDLKERYNIPKDHYISLSYDEYNKDIIVIFDFGNKMTRA